MIPEPISSALGAAGISTSAYDRIRLGRGVVGKASYVAAFAVVSLGVVAAVLRDPFFLILDACLIVFLFLVYFVGVLWFSNRNPGLSLLEGAELIQWRQMDMAAKDETIVVDAPNVEPTAIEGPDV